MVAADKRRSNGKRGLSESCLVQPCRPFHNLDVYLSSLVHCNKSWSLFIQFNPTFRMQIQCLHLPPHANYKSFSISLRCHTRPFYLLIVVKINGQIIIFGSTWFGPAFVTNYSLYLYIELTFFFLIYIYIYIYIYC